MRLDSGEVIEVVTRYSSDRRHYEVVDIYRTGHNGVLCVCLACGSTWPEGAADLPDCQPFERARVNHYD